MPATTDDHRPPCTAVDHMGAVANYDGLERCVCPTCRLYFDVGIESDSRWCSTDCRQRYDRDDVA